VSFKELFGLILQLITTWQVIVVTIVVFLYFLLIAYVARLRYKIRSSSAAGEQKRKRVPYKATPAAAEEALTENGDDLGIEEEE
jgi:preprotein translocase subunit SecY